MATKKTSTKKKHATHPENEINQSKTMPEDRIMNAIANTSVILMSTMMGAFTQVMVSATDAMASGMAEAMGGKKAGEQVNQEVKKNLPEAEEKMKKVISDIRNDIYTQMKQKRKELAPLLSNPEFEKGPKIIEKYDFKLPKLTEELDDNALAQYSQLMAKQDPRFVKMFSELAKWLNSLPNPGEQTKPKSEKKPIKKHKQKN
jgi:uncharacterized membrane protein